MWGLERLRFSNHRHLLTFVRLPARDLAPKTPCSGFFTGLLALPLLSLAPGPIKQSERKRPRHTTFDHA